MNLEEITKARRAITKNKAKHMSAEKQSHKTFTKKLGPSPQSDLAK